MGDAGVGVTPPLKRKRGRPRKVDVLAAQAAAAGGNGVLPMPPSADPKPRKPRKKKGDSLPIEVPGLDMSLVGKTVSGVLDGYFDSGFLITVRVGDSDTVFRGVVFGPGLTVPVATQQNDVAPNAKAVKRDENVVLSPTPIATSGPTLLAPPDLAGSTPQVPMDPLAEPAQQQVETTLSLAQKTETPTDEPAATASTSVLME